MIGSRRPWWLLLGLPLLLPACSSLGIAATQMVASIGRDMVLGAARDNYDGQVAGLLERFIDAMSIGPVKLSGGAAKPSATEGGAADDLPPLGIDVALFREVVVEGRSVPVPVEDGEVLRDGVGRDGPGDNMKFQVRPNQECFVYIVSVDATGWTQPLFPGGLGGGSNPVPAHQAIEVPPGDDWLYLDEYRGVETIYVLASRARRVDVEEILEEFASLERTPPVDPTPVEQPAAVSRGFAGTRPGAAPTAVIGSDGASHASTAQAFLASVGSADIVVTRWFRHE